MNLKYNKQIIVVTVRNRDKNIFNNKDPVGKFFFQDKFQQQNYIYNHEGGSVNGKPGDLDTYRATGISKHNEFRKRHGVQSLVIDSHLNDIAQKYAEEMARKQELNEHSENTKDYGENLYYECTSRESIELSSKIFS